MQIHLAGGVGRAAQAGIVAADYGFNAVEHAGIQPLALDEMFGDLEDTTVHCQIVLACGDDQVDPTDQALLVNLVMMEEGAAWRLGGADALEGVGPGNSAHVLRENLRIIEQLFEALDAVEDLDEPSVMIVERAQDSGALQFVKFGELLVGAWRTASVGDIEARKWADSIDAVGKSFGLVVAGFEITPRFDFFADVIVILRGIEIVGDNVAGGVDDAQLAVVESEAIIFFHDAHEHRGKVAEGRDFFAETLHGALEPFEGALGDGERVGDSPENGVAVRLGERLADASGNDPRGMNTLSAQLLDDFLSKLAQTDAVKRQGRVLLCDAEDIALGRIGIHAEEQVRRGKMEEAQVRGIG